MKLAMFFVAVLAVGPARAALLPMISELPVLRDIRVPSKAPKCPELPIGDRVIRLPAPFLPDEILPGSQPWEMPGSRLPSKPEQRAWLQVRDIWRAAQTGSVERLNEIFDHQVEKPAIETPAPVPVNEKTAREQPAYQPDGKVYDLPELELERQLGLK